MEHKKTNILQGIYTKHLKVINGVNLTRREVDLIAFFISGRSTKKIASFFSISPKTVENHTHNIMVKLSCNSREAIIDFVEKSDKLPTLRKYYAAILSQAKFDSVLKKLSEEIGSLKSTYSITYDFENTNLSMVVSYLQTDLNSLGLKVSNKAPNYQIDIQSTINGENKELYVSCLRSGAQNPIEIDVDPKLLDVNDSKPYFAFVLKLLKLIFHEFKVEQTLSAFEKEIDCGEETVETIPKPQIEIETHHNFYHSLRLWKWRAIAVTLALLLVGGGSVKFMQYQGLFLSKGDRWKSKSSDIRSDLDIPLKSALLKHSELLAEISNEFKGKESIQTIALIGIGGAGKTTIARRFANSQKSSVVWEINAHTKESMNESFENLAQTLAQTEEDEKRLRGILKIKERREKEKKIITFVKEQLKARSSWFLVYDDVDRFSDIQKHFPIDPSQWGQGRIIITTQDSNIINNRHVNHAFNVSELKPEDKLDLFLKIMKGDKLDSFVDRDLGKIKQFLAEIPPFPLDVSVAAYYIKATRISYKDYLANMLKYNKDFSHVQEQMLQQAGDYTKTRYGIINLSLNKLIDIRSEFKELLLFVSLLDSQNISRKLLLRIKDPSFVDNFIYRLKQYSLISNETSEGYHEDPKYSIHRSTQSIALAYMINKYKLLEDSTVIQPLLAALEGYMAEAVDNEDFSQMRDLYRHAEQVLSHDNVLEGTMAASLKGELGCIYYYLCDFTKAEDLLKQSIATLSDTQQKNYAKIARFHVFLGSVQKRLGNYEQANKLFEKSLALYEKAPDAKIGKAKASGYLGVVYEFLGDYTKAKALLEESSKIYEESPENEIGLAWSLTHLGSVHNQLGEYEKAKELYERGYAIYKTFSKDYVGAAWVCVGLGALYLELGDYSKAKEMLEESLAIYDKHFVDDHVYVARALRQLGDYYRRVGDHKKAKELLEKSLTSYQETYGMRHSETGWVLESLAKAYLLADDYEKAESLMLQALDIFDVNKSLYKFIALEDLGDLYTKKSLPESAKAYYTQALDLVNDSFPNGSPHISRLKAKRDQL